ncbi:MAG TPA: 30S ribosomal protein S20 [Anaerolineales bacterium]
MANTPSAQKRMRQNVKQRARNKAVRSRTKTYVKMANAALEASDTEAAAEAVHQAAIELDRAAIKGVIHPNNAARRKSRLMRKLNQTGSNS